jgi:tetratricopeptide (TPR) repeat protein
MKTHTRLALVCIAFFTMTIVPLHAELPPDAQEAMKKGIIAAKQQDYLLAVRYFQDARKIAPDAPEIFFNLGLAESKIPSRELRAICWLGAYLAATTNAPNAAAVKDQIDALDVKSQSNLSHLVQTMQDAANKFTWPDPDSGYHEDQKTAAVAERWAGAGDMTTALKTVGLIQGDALIKNTAYWVIAEAQADAGDIEGAKKTADLIQDVDRKVQTETYINDSHDSPKPTITVSDWLDKLDDGDQTHDSALNTDPFLDLPAYLAAQHSGDPSKLFLTLSLTSRKIVKAQNIIDQMLKQQAKQQAKP